MGYVKAPGSKYSLSVWKVPTTSGSLAAPGVLMMNAPITATNGVLSTGVFAIGDGEAIAITLVPR
jgi:hypothetical protein